MQSTSQTRSSERQLTQAQFGNLDRNGGDSVWTHFDQWPTLPSPLDYSFFEKQLVPELMLSTKQNDRLYRYSFTLHDIQSTNQPNTFKLKVSFLGKPLQKTDENGFSNLEEIGVINYRLVVKLAGDSTPKLDSLTVASIEI